MSLFRIALFLGLVCHKLVWEMMKRRVRGPADQAAPARAPIRIVKAAKVGVLGFLAVQTLCLDLWPIAADPGPLRVVGTGLYILGLTMALLGRLQLGDNWVDLEDYQVLPRQALVTRGIYRYVRHPIYAGDILLLVGLQLALNSWLVLATVIPLAIIIRQARQEEALLAHTFPDYRFYRARTKRFIPFVA